MLDTRIITRKYLILFSVFILSILVTIIITPDVLAIPNHYSNHYDDVISHQELDDSDNWRLGNNIQEGDYYSYKICNDDTMYQIIYPYHCYIISLEFVTILESYKGKVWVVQGNFTILGTIQDVSQQMIFLIDIDTFKVSTDILHKDVGVSLENTIFSLSQYGEKSLSIGTVWDSIDSYFTNKIPLEIKNKQTIQIPHTSINGTVVTNVVTSLETSVLSYDIVVPSNIYLHESFPFPLKAVMYSPHIIYPEPKEEYYFELLYYSNTSRYQPDILPLKVSTIPMEEDEK